MSSMRVKLDWVPLSSLQGRCCEKLDGRLSSQHLALRSVYEHMGPLVPPPGGLPPDPHWCDLTGARASPPKGPITTQAPEQIAQRLRTLLYGRWFLALFPERAGTSKSRSRIVVLTLGFLISNLPRSWILGRSKGEAYTAWGHWDGCLGVLWSYRKGLSNHSVFKCTGGKKWTVIHSHPVHSNQWRNAEIEFISLSDCWWKMCE